MNAGTFRFRIGEFECISTGDGALNYPPETLFANVPSEQVEETLRERGLPVDQVTTPYTCLFTDTGEHRVLVDTGAGDLGAHADQVFPGLDHSTSVTGLLPENLGAAGVEPGRTQQAQVVRRVREEPVHEEVQHVEGRNPARPAGHEAPVREEVQQEEKRDEGEIAHDVSQKDQHRMLPPQGIVSHTHG